MFTNVPPKRSRRTLSFKTKQINKSVYRAPAGECRSPPPKEGYPRPRARCTGWRRRERWAVVWVSGKQVWPGWVVSLGTQIHTQRVSTVSEPRGKWHRHRQLVWAGRRDDPAVCEWFGKGWVSCLGRQSDTHTSSTVSESQGKGDRQHVWAGGQREGEMASKPGCLVWEYACPQQTPVSLGPKTRGTGAGRDDLALRLVWEGMGGVWILHSPVYQRDWTSGHPPSASRIPGLGPWMKGRVGFGFCTALFSSENGPQVTLPVCLSSPSAGRDWRAGWGLDFAQPCFPVRTNLGSPSRCVSLPPALAGIEGQGGVWILHSPVFLPDGLAGFLVWEDRETCTPPPFCLGEPPASIILSTWENSDMATASQQLLWNAAITLACSRIPLGHSIYSGMQSWLWQAAIAVACSRRHTGVWCVCESVFPNPPPRLAYPSLPSTCASCPGTQIPSMLGKP